MDLDISGTEDTEKSFKAKFNLIIEKCKKFNINNIYVHIHPFCDALYKSDIFPWSHLLTGIQGKNPGFDPLLYMTDLSHENNIKIHAWLNPLRIKTSTTPHTLSDKSPFYKFDSDKYFLTYNNVTCFNPGYKEVRDIVTESVKEIAANYKVDGIHFDDYFYPESVSVKDAAYDENKSSSTLSIEQWRKDCVTNLIKQSYEEVKKINPQIEFGFSPPGSLEKCNLIGIDIPSLVSLNIPDYICPQIYWSLEYKVMPFEKTAILWKDMLKDSKIKLFGGLALYKIQTDCDNCTWKNDVNILAKELDILNNLNYDGTVLYSFGHLDDSKEEIINLNKKLKG